MLHDVKIPLLTDALHSHAHNKIIILDDAVVITGSFNFTRQAEIGNSENLLVIRGSRQSPGSTRRIGRRTPRTAVPGHWKGRGHTNRTSGCINATHWIDLAFLSPPR